LLIAKINTLTALHGITFVLERWKHKLPNAAGPEEKVSLSITERDRCHARRIIARIVVKARHTARIDHGASNVNLDFFFFFFFFFFFVKPHPETDFTDH
jgi:hypothetical protein